jgi:peroxiredoxin
VALTPQSSQLKYIGAGLCIIIIMTLSYYFFVSASSTSKNSVQQKTASADFNLPSVDGKQYQLKDFAGKKIIINFWASWCAPCREEIPALNRAWQQLQNHNIAMLAINYGEDLTRVESFLKDYPIDFTVLLDQHNIASENMQVNVMPTTFIIDENGDILDTILGPRAWDSLEMIERITKL